MSPTIRKDIHDTANDWYGLDLTEAQIDEILAEPDISGECLKWGIDTCTREMIGKFLANKIVGRDWPMNRDGEEAGKKFFAEFEQNAPLKGYRLTSRREDTP